MTSVPVPGEVHPAYAGQQHLVDFASGRMPELGAYFMVPVFRGPAYLEPIPAPVALRCDRLLQLRTMVGLAPYVGRPFVYAWGVAFDDLGRFVVGDEARIEYLP